MLRTVSLYSGAGGMDYGFHLAGFEYIVAVDFDKDPIETLNGLLPNPIGVCGDVDNAIFPSPSKVDVVIGGPPCQGFSVAGYMDPLDDRSRHVWRFLEVVGQLQPRAFVMENVRHLGENARWATIREGLIRASNALGYQTRLSILRASHFGVPQNRDRMFLVGARDFTPSPLIPTTADSLPTSRQALTELPPIGTEGNSRIATADITLAANPVLRRSPFAGMLFNGAGRPVNLEAPSSTLPASMGGNKTPIIDQLWLEGKSELSWVHMYHEHLWNGGAPYAMRDVPEFLRRLSVEEAAALQSFPRHTPWSGPTSAVFRQIGNAVPPMLACAVALQLREDLEKSRPKRLPRVQSHLT
ncbi:MAG: DNA cytosine methyltransferase [Actinomycetota bacterium]